ncbi:MAG: trypsin-like peptidase domain-containing protein [Myxococcota bacterium]
MRRTSAIALLSLVFCACSDTHAQQPQDDRSASQVTPAVTPMRTQGLIETERNTIAVFEAAAPATVFVTQKSYQQNPYTRQLIEVESGTGSGFLWDDQGHVVTNYHVVNGGRRFEVSLQGGNTYAAEFVGGDPTKDIAVLKLRASDDATFIPIRLPASQNTPLQVGQKAIAIGNPFGLDHTLTSGVVSATDREVKGFSGLPIKGMVQTDASINPGNSGGPLLNSRGELIGMNTMIFSQSGGSAGIGFAVPVNTIRRIVPQLIDNGRVTQVGIGVQLVDQRVARWRRIKGVIIGDVIAGSPAAEAGLVGIRQDNRGQIYLGDVIIGVEGQNVVNYDDLYIVLDGRRPGETVTLLIERDNQRREVALKLYEIPSK